MLGCWHRYFSGYPAFHMPAGVWRLKITRTGKLFGYTPGRSSCDATPDFPWRISAVAGSHLTMGAWPICYTSALYRWKATSNTLTLQTATDKNCPPRRLLFSGLWKKS
jgi:hypothetical protein